MLNGDVVSGREGSAQAPGTSSRLVNPPPIIREGAWVGMGQVVATVAGLAGTRLLTTLLPPAAYGEISLVTGLGALGAGLLCSPFLQAALRSFPDARDAGKIGALRGLSRHYVGRGAAAVGALLVAAGASWAVWGPTRISFAIFAVFVAAAASVAADAWRAYESGFLNASRRQRDVALRTALDAIARPAIAVSLVLWLGPSAFHAVLGFAAGSVLISTLLRHRTVTGADVGPWRGDSWAVSHRTAFLRYAVPLVPMAALNWVISMGDRYVLAGTWGAEVVGIYWAAYALGSQSFIAANTLIHTTLRPVLYDAVARGDSRKERRTLRIWLLVVASVAIVGWVLTTVLARPLCRIVLGPAYGAAADLLPWIGAAYALQMIQQTFEVVLYADGGSKRLVALQAVAAMSAMAFYALLIPRYGARGAAMATLGTFVITTTLAFVLSGAGRRILGKPGPAAP